MPELNDAHHYAGNWGNGWESEHGDCSGFDYDHSWYTWGDGHTADISISPETHPYTHLLYMRGILCLN